MACRCERRITCPFSVWPLGRSLPAQAIRRRRNHHNGPLVCAVADRGPVVVPLQPERKDRCCGLRCFVYWMLFFAKVGIRSGLSECSVDRKLPPHSVWQAVDARDSLRSARKANMDDLSHITIKMSSLSRRACYKCGNVGHYAEVCSSAERLCYNCKLCTSPVVRLLRPLTRIQVNSPATSLTAALCPVLQRLSNAITARASAMCRLTALLCA
ncbi:hypothetical protein LY78DRAFT_98396 [Colletotrichum sublineola]|nr:hypothetical protein LY78DRAFT_98396 [Colletotrichum sublineola]